MNAIHFEIILTGLVCIIHHFSCFPFSSRLEKKNEGRRFHIIYSMEEKGIWDNNKIWGNSFSPSLLKLKSKCGIFLYCLEFADSHKVRYYVLEYSQLLK